MIAARERRKMLALVNTPNGKAPVELRQTPEPAPRLNLSLIHI